jgi:hypothetical protein
MIDIGKPTVVMGLCFACLVAGAILGYMSHELFYSVSHVKIGGTGGYAVAPITDQWGIIFILIMMGTALAIALTFRYVPRWVIAYYEKREMPTWVGWLKEKLNEEE